MVGPLSFVSLSAPLWVFSCRYSSHPPIRPLHFGCALRGPPFVEQPFVEQKLLSNLTPLLEKLMAFEDTQAASFLLRISFSAVRATHFMRTTPLTHWRSIATTFDSNIRRAFESIVGFPLPLRLHPSFTHPPARGLRNPSGGSPR